METATGAMKQNVDIPDPLPLLEHGIIKFVEWRDKPCKALGGLVPLDLFKGQLSLDIDRAWFFGSCVWMPMVQGKAFHGRYEPDNDVDVCFYTEDVAREFADRVTGMLTTAYEGKRSSAVQLLPSKNRWGGPKIFVGDRQVMDVTWLPTGHTIAEFISGFLYEHEHVAIMAGARLGDIGAVTRIVRTLKHEPYNHKHRAWCVECQRRYDADHIGSGS